MIIIVSPWSLGIGNREGVATAVISVIRNFRCHKRRKLVGNVVFSTDAEITPVSVPVLATEKRRKGEKKRRTGRTKDRMYLVSNPARIFYATRRRKRRKKKKIAGLVDTLPRDARSKIDDDRSPRRSKTIALPYLETSNYCPRHPPPRFN